MAYTLTYPLGYDVPYKPRLGRLSTAFRLILSFPHMLFAGTPTALGLLGSLASLTAIIAWFAIMFTGRYPRDLWNFGRFYLRWRANALSYLMLLRDEFPPFGEGAYPVWFWLEYPERSSRWKALLRLVLVLPQLVAVYFVGQAWLFTTIIAWFGILLTGAYPRGLFTFGAGVMRWALRVEAYLLLLRDEYPPFALRP